MKRSFLLIFLVLIQNIFSQTIKTPGSHPLQRREIVYSDEYLEIMTKIDESIKAHPQEYQEWMESESPEKPLGYNPILGITNEEFDIYLLHAERYVRIETKEKKMLNIEREHDGIFLRFSKLYALPDVFIANDFSYAAIHGKRLQKETDGNGKIIFWITAPTTELSDTANADMQQTAFTQYRFAISQEKKKAWNIDFYCNVSNQDKKDSNQYLFLLE